MTESSRTPGLSRATTLLLAGLMVLSTGFFVTGVALERSTSDTGAASIPGAPIATQAPEGSEAREAQERQEATTTHPDEGEGSAAHEAAEQNQVLGIDGESPWVVASFVLATLLLIVALFVFGARVLRLVVAFALIATVFDVREVGHQLGQAHYLIAVLALAIVISRIATAFIAWRASATEKTHV
jgi:hypothetical protein